MPLRDGFFSTATQTSCCNRIQRSNRVRLLVVSTHDFPDILSNKSDQYVPTVLINNSKFLKATHRTKIRKIEIPRSMVVEALSW